MSMITQMVLYLPFDDDAAVRRLNEWCAVADPNRKQQFRQLNVDAAGGSKFFTGEVWAMAGNYFPHEQLIEAMPSFNWQFPSKVVLIVNGEDSDGSEVHRP